MSNKRLNGIAPRFVVIACLYSLCALLLVSVVVQGIFRWRYLDTSSPQRVKITPIPPNLYGYSVRNLEVADSEVLSKAVSEGLGFTDYSYREFRRGDQWFSVYLAYWSPLVRHFAEVGTHVPDNCWTANGWTMLSRDRRRSFGLANQPGSGVIENGVTWPAESRVFLAGSQQLYVVYWHLLSGRPLDYSNYGQGKTVGYFWDNRFAYLRGAGEQYFVRVTSNQSWAQLEFDEGFKLVLSQLASSIPLRAIEKK